MVTQSSGLDQMLTQEQQTDDGTNTGNDNISNAQEGVSASHGTSCSQHKRLGAVILENGEVQVHIHRVGSDCQSVVILSHDEL